MWMPVMNVREVWVHMRDRLMYMRMGMRFRTVPGEIMLVLVMDVMAVRMRV